MKLLYKNLSLNQLILFISVNLLLVSCGTYQNVSSEDGIYDDEILVKDKKQVVVVNEKEYKKYEENYFTKKLEALKSIDDNEIFLDVDSYNSDNTYLDDEVIDETLDYEANQPWGYEDNNAVIHINLISNPYWNSYNNWGYYGNGYNNWQNRNWYYNDWGYNPYWHPYHGGYAWNLGFYNPYYYNRPLSNYNRNYTYGRRVANNTYNRRNSNTNSRYSTSSSRRSTSTSRRSSTNKARRNTSTTNPTRRSSTTRRSTSTIRRRSTPTKRTSTTKRNNTSKRSSSSTKRRSSSSSSRNSNSSARRSSSSRNTSSSSSRKRGN